MTTIGVGTAECRTPAGDRAPFPGDLPHHTPTDILILTLADILNPDRLPYPERSLGRGAYPFSGPALENGYVTGTTRVARMRATTTRMIPRGMDATGQRIVDRTDVTGPKRNTATAIAKASERAMTPAIATSAEMDATAGEAAYGDFQGPSDTLAVGQARRPSGRPRHRHDSTCNDGGASAANGLGPPAETCFA